ARTRRRLAMAGGLAILGGIAFAGYRYDLHQRTRACADEGARIDLVWNDEARANVRAGLLATGVPYAETTATNVMSWLDAHAESWRSTRADACVARDVDGTTDATAHEAALWCLDERRMELDALVLTLAEADLQAVQRAVPAAAALAQPTMCRD